MRKWLVVFGVVVVVVSALVLAFLLLPLEPTAVTHAETAVSPIGLPPTGAGGLHDGFGVAVWAVLALVGTAVLGVSAFVLARRSP